jgi:ABC-type amino acid transport substrate-binding protein
MKTFFYSLVLFCVATMAHATGPRVTSALLTPAVNEIFALDFSDVLCAEASDGGIAAALITAAFKAEKVESTLTVLPLKTMLTYYLNEENALGIAGHDLDLSAAELKNLIVVPVLNLKESYFYYRPRHETLAWTGKLADLKAFTVGVNKGETLTAYQKAGIHIEQDRLDARIKALIAGKIDLLRESDLTMKAALAKNFSDQQSAIVRLEPSTEDAVISIVFNKKNLKGAVLAKQFQSGLAKLIATGQYNEIIKAHIRDLAIESYFVPLKR